MKDDGIGKSRPNLRAPLERYVRSARTNGQRRPL